MSLAELSNRSGEVIEVALRGAVEITRRKFMLLTCWGLRSAGERCRHETRFPRRRRAWGGCRHDAGGPHQGRRRL